MENKKTKIINIVALVALALTVITATYAYFQAQTGEGSQTDIKVNANTVDTFTFSTGNQITLNLDQESFASGKGNITGSTYASAMLTANNKTNTATEHYYLYLNIEDNTFKYTKNFEAEILLMIKDANNNEITSISGLEYKTITDAKDATLKGFDITTQKGFIPILKRREISTTSSKTDTWNITITFVNYDRDQSANAGKNFSAKLLIQKESSFQKISDVCKTGNYLIDCMHKLNYLGDSETTKLYYHDNSLTNGAEDDFLRYSGGMGEVNNYICIEPNSSSCSSSDLFRIISWEGAIKVISAAPLANYPWDSNGSNIWSTSSLKTFFDNIYYQSLSTVLNLDWVNYSIPTTALTNATPKTIRSMESQSIISKTNSYVSLPSLSDFAYASSPKFWNQTLVNLLSEIDNNWMFEAGTQFWTIDSDSESSDKAINTLAQSINVTTSLPVRPILFINGKYVTGTGEPGNPIIIIN